MNTHGGPGLNYDYMFKWIQKKQTELIQLKLATGEGNLSEPEDDSDSSTSVTRIMNVTIIMYA